MVTYYTALGRLNNSFNKTNIPEVIQGDRRYELEMPEFIIWSSVIWNIYNYDELKRTFEKRVKELKVNPDFEFDYYLQRMEYRGLIKAGKGCTAIEALYSLMLDLYIFPINCSYIGRTIVFLKLLIKKMPFKVAVHAFDKNKIDNKDERSVWTTITKAMLSVSETIWCVAKDIKGIREDNLIEKIYGEEYNSENLASYAKLSDEKHKIITAIVNLYLRRMIIFER